MSFKVGDTVKNSKTNKVYKVVSIDEQPYLELVPADAAGAPAQGEEAISMHQDFVEKVEA